MRWMVTAATIVALVAAGCSSGSHHDAKPGPTVSTSRPTTPSSTSPAVVALKGCAAGAAGSRAAVLGRSHAWVQMVSAHGGFAVAGRTIVGTVDGRAWTVLYSAPDDLSFVDAIDADHVWAVGARFLFASFDGGKHWTASTPPIALEMVHFVDAANGWGVAQGSLLRSTDGGHSWRVTTAPCPVDRACFRDTLDGWIATHDTVQQTADGGRTWFVALKVTDPGANRGVALDVQCTTTGGAWVLFNGNNQVSGREGYAGYRCTHASVCGVVVRNNSFPPVVADSYGPGASPGPFSVIDDHTAVFVGFSPLLTPATSTMLVSADGRSRGDVLAMPDGPPSQSVPNAASYTSDAAGWIIDGASGEWHILGTTNGGKTWTVQYRQPIR